MIDNPYQQFERKSMILRDWLALDRTVLANMRTFLSFGRTSIALIVLGLAFVKFLKHIFLVSSGYALIGIGVIVFFTGLAQFVRQRHRLGVLYADVERLEEELEAETAGTDTAPSAKG